MSFLVILVSSRLAVGVLGLQVYITTTAFLCVLVVRLVHPAPLPQPFSGPPLTNCLTNDLAFILFSVCECWDYMNAWLLCTCNAHGGHKVSSLELELHM